MAKKKQNKITDYENPPVESPGKRTDLLENPPAPETAGRIKQADDENPPREQDILARRGVSPDDDPPTYPS